jgi:uncharacterized Fe-S radical SAM superfamily protein PflX
MERLLNEAKEFEKGCEFCVQRCGQPLPKPKVFCAKGWAKERLAAPALELHFRDAGLNDITGSAPERAVELSTPAAAAAWIDRNAKGHRAIVITGSPAHFLPFIISVVSKAKAKLPLVLGAHPYFSEVASSLLKPLMDLYVFTLAFSDPGCAGHLLSAEDYPAAARRACAEAEKAGDVIVHIPVMPAHLECDAKETVRWIANNLGDCAVRILKDWQPQLAAAELSRRPTITELHDVAQAAYNTGLNVLEE